MFARGRGRSTLTAAALARVPGRHAGIRRVKAGISFKF